MEQQIKDTPKNKSNISKTSKSIFHFYPDRCIALGDYLDILLNRVNASGRRNLPAFEDINYSLEPKSKLVPLSSYTPNVSANKRTSTNQMKNGNSKQPENEEKFLFEGGILLPRPLESEREGKEVSGLQLLVCQGRRQAQSGRQADGDVQATDQATDPALGRAQHGRSHRATETLPAGVESLFRVGANTESLALAGRVAASSPAGNPAQALEAG